MCRIVGLVCIYFDFLSPGSIQSRETCASSLREKLLLAPNLFRRLLCLNSFLHVMLAAQRQRALRSKSYLLHFYVLQGFISIGLH